MPDWLSGGKISKNGQYFCPCHIDCGSGDVTDDAKKRDFQAILKSEFTPSTHQTATPH
jgi:hypothetical protein